MSQHHPERHISSTITLRERTNPTDFGNPRVFPVTPHAGCPVADEGKGWKYQKKAAETALYHLLSTVSTVSAGRCTVEGM